MPKNAGPPQVMPKTAVRSVARLLMRVLTSALLLLTLIVNFRRIANAEVILLCPHGGFGHTLSVPECLRSISPHSRNLVIFGRWSQRHNPLIAELWGRDRFLWVWSAIWLPRLGVVADFVWCETLFDYVETQLKRVFPKKRILNLWMLMWATPRPPWVEPGSKYDVNRECRLYALRARFPAPALHLGANRIRVVEGALRNVVGTGYRRRCNLYLRSRQGDISLEARCAQPIAAYEPLIRYLLDQEFLILVTGDVEIGAATFAAEPLVVDWRRLGISKHLFNVFAGTETDLHIGNLSGGSAYTFVTDIQTVLIDALSFGDAYPKATIQYKRLLRADGSLVPMATLFDKYALDYECRDCRFVEATAQEMLDVVKDVVENGLGIVPYGIRPETLGLYAPILKSADARLSPVWVSGFLHEVCVDTLADRRPPQYQLQGRSAPAASVENRTFT
jgi:hypothetical protein